MTFVFGEHLEAIVHTVTVFVQHRCGHAVTDLILSSAGILYPGLQ